MAKRGRKKGTTNQVLGHLFGAESMNHIASFKGTSQSDVREQMIEWMNGGARAGEKLLILWGMGEIITIVAAFSPVTTTASYDEDFFLSRGGILNDNDE